MGLLGSRPEFSAQQSDTQCAALARRTQCPADLSDPNLSCTIHFSDIVLPARRYSAIVYASRIDNLMRMGQYTEAQECSRKAKMWCWISFGIGIPANIIAFIFQFAAEFADSGF